MDPARIGDSRGRGVLLRAPDGETFRFDPGALCLEFAVTGGQGERAVFETLHTPADLRRWMGGALATDVAAVDDGDLVAATQLREAIWRCAEARARGRPLPATGVRDINRAAAGPPPVPRIDGRGRGGWVTPVTPGQVGSLLARDAVALLTGTRAGRIRQCGAGDCALVFVDTSRPGRRRWCSMERCGNRAKVRAHRDRHRS